MILLCFQHKNLHVDTLTCCTTNIFNIAMWWLQQFHEKCRTNSLKTFHSDARSVIFVTSPTYYEHQLGSESSGTRVYMRCAANCLTIYVTTNIGVKIAFHFDVLYTFVYLMPFTSLPFRFFFNFWKEKKTERYSERYCFWDIRVWKSYDFVNAVWSLRMPYVIFMPVYISY